MSIFHLLTYRDVINQKIQENAKRRGYKLHLSKKMKMQSSQLSQVLAGKVDLSSDQGAWLCDEWHFNKEESEYFLNLIALERATTLSLKKRIKSRVEELQRKLGAENSIKVVPEPKGEMTYLPLFTSWTYSIIYGLLRLDNVKDEYDLEKRLELPLSTIKRVLEGLAEMNLIEFTNEGWSVKENSAISASLHTRAIFQAEMRSKAHQMFIDGDTEMLRSTAVAVVRNERFFEFREKLEALIAEFNVPWSDNAKGESLAVLNVDFFRVGKPL